MIRKIRGGRRWWLWSVAALGIAVSVIFLARAPGAEESGGGGAALIASLRGELATLRPEVRYLRDRRDIFDAAKRYTRGADRHDKELARSAFWPDATISFGVPMSRDQYIETEEHELAGYAAHQHHITGQTIDIVGDTAHVENSVLLFLVPRDRTVDVVGPPSLGRARKGEKTQLRSGRYVERWERRNNEWRILVREYVEDLVLLGDTVDLCGGDDLHFSLSGRAGCLASWDHDDPSYYRPLNYLTPEQRSARGEANRQPRHPDGAAGSAR